MSNEPETPPSVDEVKMYDKFFLNLSPAEKKELFNDKIAVSGLHPPKTSASPPSHTTPRGKAREKRKRRDLSGDYLTKRDKNPSDLLNDELAAIIAEHEVGGNECAHKSLSAAPFISIVQSTGCGKTRAILQLAKSKRQKVVYLLCKSLDESWSAPRVLRTILHQMADDGENKEELYERKWHNFFNVVQDLVKSKYDTPEALYEAQITGEWELGNFYEELFSAWEAATTPQKTPLRPVMKPTEHALQSNKLDKSKGKRVTFDYSQAAPIRKGCLVLCFDEVSAFKKPAFKALRRAAKTNGIICVFADTAASICELMDPNGHSSKAKGGHLGRFVVPIFALNTGDLEWSRKCRDDDYKALFCAGRPRWLSHYNMCKLKGEDEEHCIESLIGLAQGLLLNENGDQLAGEDVQYYGSTKNASENLPSQVLPGKIAAFTSRFSLGAESRISSILVKHSVATVIGISEDREIVSCAYPSEPVLAEASARFTAAGKENLRGVLQHVKGAIHGSEKLLDPPKGDSGEMCAAALLGYSMDIVRKERGDTCMSMPVPLIDFLSIVYGARDEFTESDEIKKSVNNWNVNFTHFDRPVRMPTQSDLMIMWKRRLAYYVPEGAEGLDLLIATRNDEGNCYGTIRVQVKNYRNEISVGERTNWLYALLPTQCPPYFDDPFSVSLLLSVNGIKKSCRLHDSNGNLIHDTMLAKNKRTTTRLQGGKDQRHVLQLATCFPCDQDSELGWIATELRNICSLETSKQVSKDYFCHAYTDEVLECEKERVNAELDVQAQ